MANLLSGNYSNLLILLGEPGQGKSSLCKYFLYKYRTTRKVFVLKLNPTVANIIQEKQVSIEGIFSLDSVLLSKEVLDGALVFLDGFDELYITLQKFGYSTWSFFNRINNYAKEYSIQVVITSRKSCISIEDLMNTGYSVVELADLSKLDQKKWINQVTQKLPQRFNFSDESLDKIYTSSSDLVNLIKIPILFQMVVIYNFTENIRNRSELYYRLFNKIVIDRNHESTLDLNLESPDDVHHAYEELAYRIFQNNDVNTILVENMWSPNSLDSRLTISFYIKTDHNLYGQYIEFIHRSFYQYFLASFIYRRYMEILLKIDNRDFSERVESFLYDLSIRRLEPDVILFIKYLSEFRAQKSLFNFEYLLKYLNEHDCFCYKIIEKKVTYPMDVFSNIFFNIINIVTATTPYDSTIIMNKYERLCTLLKIYDCEDMHLERVDFSKCDLSGTTFTNVNFCAANFSQASLSGSTIINCNFSDCIMSGTSLIGTDFFHCIFKKTDFSKAIYHQTYFESCNIKRDQLNQMDYC